MTRNIHSERDVILRQAGEADLDAINIVIERAVMDWKLPERVKRLSLGSYLYRPHDLDHMKLLVAARGEGEIVGVAAMEALAAAESPDHRRALLLHGLYVDPAYQRRGIGRRLFAAVEEKAAAEDFKGLLVRAQADASEFFISRGMQRLDVDNGRRDHPNRFWRVIDQTNGRECTP